MNHPYRSLPDTAFWRRAVASLPADHVDPASGFALRITRETKVATAGSCFAQHIARHLTRSGYRHYVVEDGHPILPGSVRTANRYGEFSARYGNIYTALQLRQLMERACGTFAPTEGAWIEADGRVLDPFRPAIQPGGFISVAEMEADRAQHLASVRRMFETCDVFVFTLGLTEGWVSKADGAAFPLCPGVEGGTFDPERYAFRNQTADEVTADMTAFIEQLRSLNPDVRVVLTVSPVPLVATAERDAHVLSATTYSKSVLRVAAQALSQSHRDVHYFPSYEIVTGVHARGRYFGADLRSVTEEGVAHVMRLFLSHVAGTGAGTPPPPPQPPVPDLDTQAIAAELVAVECEEAALDRPVATPAPTVATPAPAAATTLARDPPPSPSPKPAAAAGILGRWLTAAQTFMARTRIESASLKTRIPGLDELRGVAVLWVMVSHGAILFTWLPLALMGYGYHGVVLFFIVSGYLITRILVDQIATGKPLMQFFVRRFLRIWPLMIAALAVGAALMPQYAGSAAYNFLLVNNFSRAFGIEPVFRTDVMWSLAIEEQFYLLWPFAVLALGRRLLPVAVFGIILTGFCFDAGINPNPWTLPVFSATYGCMQYIALGAAVALGREGLRAAIAAIVVFIALFAVSSGLRFFAELRYIWWGITIALFAVVYATVHWRPLVVSRFLAFSGRLCYGLYIIHFFFSYAVLENIGRGWIVPGAAYFAASYAVAIASLYLLERPALALRPRIEAEPRLQAVLLIAVLCVAGISLVSVVGRVPAP